jgi:hypothetical protein
LTLSDTPEIGASSGTLNAVVSVTLADGEDRPGPPLA